MLSKPEINSSLRKMMDTTDYGYIKTMPLSTYQHMAMHFLDINDTLALKNTSRGFYKNVTQQFDKYIVLILDNSSSMHIHCRNGHSRLIIMTRLIHEFTSTWAPNTRILLLFVDPTHASRYHNKVVDIQFLRTVICPWLHEFEDTTLFSFIGSNRNREIAKTELLQTRDKRQELCVHMWDTHPEIRKIVHVEIKRLYFLGF